jgi:hypothetical protein
LRHSAVRPDHLRMSRKPRVALFLAWAVLVGLHVFLVAGFALLAWPIGAQLVAFYALALLALLSLLAAPVLELLTRRPVPAA